MPANDEFVSEPIKPDPGTGDAAAMARGQPGLPTGFTWRDRHYVIRELLESWKQSEPCDHHSGERYYRKHYFRVLTDSGETMTLYALRHVKRGQDAKSRWWLYMIEGPEDAGRRGGTL
jgi:hypothetical protein